MLPQFSQTVTLYRQTPEGIFRQVLDGCFYSWQTEQTEEEAGLRQDTRFLLVIPGACDIRPGDRVFDGIGPETVDWERFLPVCVPGLSQVAYVKPCYFGSILCHTEAGRR